MLHCVTAYSTGRDRPEYIVGNVMGVFCGLSVVPLCETLAVSDLGVPARGAMCPNQQFSEGHFVFWVLCFFTGCYVINKIMQCSRVN